MNEKSIRVRVPYPLYEEFKKVCGQNDRTASQVVREAMREYIVKGSKASDLDSDKDFLEVRSK